MCVRLRPSSSFCAKMIETEMLPISVVEGEGFKEIIWYLETTATVTNHIEKLFEEKDMLKLKLASADWEIQSNVLLSCYQ